ncbi:MAG: acyltransferase domain-containing protein, partial [Candidatus Hydrogenedentes bacterium]|nr:acyltransferase domain-containing protein [Candidatus Hydrogenedentota bacterium]
FNEEGREAPAGNYLSKVEAPLTRFRIPPKELEEMLPQQLLMLQTALNAWEDAARLESFRGREETGHADTGVFIGVALDLNTTNFHVRWMLEQKARTWAADTLTAGARTTWIECMREAYGPPLTPNRVMGALASVIASRIARELKTGGPSFTIASEDTSGLNALQAAVRALQRREINKAVVGAVDLPGDPRMTLSDTQGVNPPREGAVALVLKRVEDANRDGDRVYAVIRGIDFSSGGEAGGTSPDGETIQRSISAAISKAGVGAETIGLVECSLRGEPEHDRPLLTALQECFAQPDKRARARLNSLRASIGHTGAAAGLAALAKVALCLHHHVVPPLPWDLALEKNARLRVPRGAEHWLHDRAEGPRRALVQASSVQGTCASVVLEAATEVGAGTKPRQSIPQRLPLAEEALFVVRAARKEDLVPRLDSLRSFGEHAATRPFDLLAREWHTRTREPVAGLAVTFVARSVAELLDQVSAVTSLLREAPEKPIGARGILTREPFLQDRVFYSPGPLAEQGQLAFVFPGSGNHYGDMGRELFALFPEILQSQDANNQHLRTQFQADVFWNPLGETNLSADHEAMIFGQVSLGTALSDLLRAFGLCPRSVIGYSLGETAGLFALGAWKDRDAMLQRIHASRLFTHDLAGDCDAARRRWRLPKQEAVDWVLGVIDRPMKVARAALKNRKKVYPLIANTLHESVIGGNRHAVEKLITALQCQFIPLSGVTTVHCEIVKEVEQEYRDIHLFETTPPPGIRFYSGAWGRAYDVTRESAADSILAQAIDGVDFPKVIEAAYADGARIFVELGPGNSCTRMIGRILGDRSHVARAFCFPGQPAFSILLRGLAQLIAEGVAVDLDVLYERGAAADWISRAAAVNDPKIVLQPGGAPFTRPDLSTPAPAPEVPRPEVAPVPAVRMETYVPAPEVQLEIQPSPPSLRSPAPGCAPVAAAEMTPLLTQWIAAQAATAAAHSAYLEFSTAMSETLAQVVQPRSRGFQPRSGSPQEYDWEVAQAPETGLEAPAMRLTREQCLEFAVGSIARVLGEEYAEVDSYPTRVRLPDEPLMLVDRITEIEGAPRSLEPGRVVTEHDVLHGAWYLDGGRIPTCIAVEAGQADLFLSGYLGIDAQTRGRSMYRLLDAEVTFHSRLPVPGQVIRYDIHIDRFFRHGNPWFFHFHFDATVDGQPLMSMRNGCAGFFTQEELAAGQGVVDPSIRRAAPAGGSSSEQMAFVPLREEAYSETHIEALRRGDLAACFGPAFADLPLSAPLPLPAGRMRLVHRVTALEPVGGRYAAGRIVAEADIHPDDWFLTCHFVDDRVMPGTLMYECCLHTLRIYLTRLGWVGEAAETAWGPIPGVTSRLKCRGQVLETTRLVTYEVMIKEVGFRPEPFALADAKMYADGKAIVEIADMSLQLTGSSHELLSSYWASNSAIGPTGPMGKPSEKPALYTEDQILAFAEGKPSEAFGERYRVFDTDRFIARLPRPPYSFVSRITDVRHEAWKMAAGGMVEAQYDIPPDAWYFAADRQEHMPYAVLLEAALQVCGWFSAYMGSALHSETDLKYRNLGGTCTLFQPVTRDMGLLTTQVRCTGVSQSGGMIIQHFELDVTSPRGRVYQGSTYFGFFSPMALDNQLGIRDAQRHAPAAGSSGPVPFPHAAPFPDERLRMVESIDAYLPKGGPAELGFIRGSKTVNHADWFFTAHFYQDPVMPGSLGLESFLQLLKFAAHQRWNLGGATQFIAPVLGRPHTWIYRGQVVPRNGEMTIEAAITQADDARKLLVADGFVLVDWLPIYELRNFGLQCQ